MDACDNSLRSRRRYHYFCISGSTINKNTYTIIVVFRTQLFKKKKGLPTLLFAVLSSFRKEERSMRDNVRNTVVYRLVSRTFSRMDKPSLFPGSRMVSRNYGHHSTVVTILFSILTTFLLCSHCVLECALCSSSSFVLLLPW